MRQQLLCTFAVIVCLKFFSVASTFGQDLTVDSLTIQQDTASGAPQLEFPYGFNFKTFYLDGPGTPPPEFVLENRNGNSTMTVLGSAQFNLLNLTPYGMGVGVRYYPEAILHVKEDEESAEVLRLENDSTTTRVRNLLTLKNKGGARFALQNTDSGKRWVISTDNNDTLFWTESNSADPSTAPYFRMFLRTNAHNILAQMGRLGDSKAKFSLLTTGTLNLSGVVNEGSDRNMKKDFQEVDVEDVLEKVLRLPLTTWTYINDPDTIRHMGPMAQDFSANFGLGENETSIAGVDRDGVALAAIQGLNQRLLAKNARIEELEQAWSEQSKKIEGQTKLLENQSVRLDEMEQLLAAMASKRKSR